MSRFTFVADHHSAYGVKRLCGLLHVSRSGFYRWLRAAPARAEREHADQALSARIAEIHEESDSTYGSPRITAELREEGRLVNHKRVARLMRRCGIVGVHLRKKVRTTVPAPDAVPVPDLLAGHHRRALSAQTLWGGCASSSRRPAGLPQCRQGSGSGSKRSGALQSRMRCSAPLDGTPLREIGTRREDVPG